MPVMAAAALTAAREVPDKSAAYPPRFYYSFSLIPPFTTKPSSGA